MLPDVKPTSAATCLTVVLSYPFLLKRRAAVCTNFSRRLTFLLSSVSFFRAIETLYASTPATSIILFQRSYSVGKKYAWGCGKWKPGPGPPASMPQSVLRSAGAARGDARLCVLTACRSILLSVG